jgi:ubiquinol-cytochrome c reductase iron-sulfur subunit
LSDNRPPRIGDDIPLYAPSRGAATDQIEAGPSTGPATSSSSPAVPTPPAKPPVDPADRFRERLVRAVFLASAAAAVGFFVMFAIHAKPTDNWINGWLGGLLGVSLIALGTGAVLWAKLLMPHEEAVEERHAYNSSPVDLQSAGESFNAGVEGSGIARRPLLRRTLLLASGALALPLLATLRGLGPRPKGELAHTKWTAGARMVDQFNTPLKLGDIAQNGYDTVFPENFTDPDSAASSAVMLIRLPVGLVRPKQLAKSYQGHVAYSKICTHAGCPAGLYDEQTHVLLCPCHQSQFKVLEGCKPVAGPAARSLPQLGITVDPEGYFIATGDFDEPIGPGFWERKS